MTLATAFTVVRPVRVRSVADVCGFVDDLPSDATGELVFAGRSAEPDGAVFVENGRVCWAAARGLARRLGDLLAASAKLDARAMETLYVRCKERRTPLGEYLVDTGLVTEAALRSALLEHSAASLGRLCSTETGATWTARRGAGYASRFTFATSELLTRTYAETQRAAVASVEAELTLAFSDGGWGAAFLRSPDRAEPDPVAVCGEFPSKVDALLKLGRWAASALDVTEPLHGPRTLVASMVSPHAVVAWRSGSAILAGWTTQHGPARLLNRRSSERRQEAAHGRL